MTYFEDVVRARDTDLLRSAIKDTIDADEEAILEQLIRVSRIAAQKYSSIRLAFLFLLVLVAAALGCVVEVLYG